ncbi:hypothetical protein [endosymbiont GvMRE of Glomus versiforme]|uniref:hypothetical protein n=1 Tax=endosymbiont GvMRE of Glomus versiforme TaxID=2039283 RepID=UPI000EB9955F|nr:hypothetical protein [endosymbiont GvMRE of Glomus versiforme]RHZ36691.1 hypothetical protein GvMRE_I2g374 [endosymbiont GvMRE of Glomus versiforme]
MVRYYTECLDFEKDELGRYKKIGTNQRGAKIEHDKHNCTNDCYVLCGWKREESIVRIWQCERCGSNNIKSEELADTSKIEDIDFGVDYYEVLGLPENASKREIRDKGIKLITKLDKKVRIEIPDRIKKQVEEELKRKLGRTPTGLEIEKEAEPRIRTDNADVSDKEIIKATRELRFAKEAYETLFNNQKRKKIDDGYLGIKDKVTCYSHQPAVGEVIVGKGKTGIQKNLAKKHSHLYFCKQACLDQCFIMWGENTASSNSGSSGSSFCYVCHQVKNPVKKKRGESKYCCYDCYFKFPTCHQCPKKCWQGSRLKLIEAGKDVRFCSWDCTNAWWEKNKEKLAKQELKKIIDQASNGSLKTAEEIQKAIDLLKIFGNSPLGSAKKKAWDENLAQCLLLYGLLQEKKQIVDLQNKVIREIENYWISKVGSLTNKINNWTIEQVLNSGFMTWKTNLRAKTTRGEIIVEQNRLIRLIDDAVAKQQQQQQQHTPNSSSHQSNSGTSSSNFSSSNTSSTGDSSQDFPSSSQNDSPQSSSARGTNSTPSSSGSNDNSSSSSPGTSPSSTSSSIGSGSSSGSSSFGEGGGGIIIQVVPLLPQLTLLLLLPNRQAINRFLTTKNPKNLLPPQITMI